MSFRAKRANRAAFDICSKPKVANRETNFEHEVFLSFCGDDTRKSFVDFLYESLTRAGVATFRDDEGIHKGNNISSELLNAIQKSAISIPVFSEHYAFRKWCLLELSEMVKCSKKNKHMILPIFYDVEPADVRNQTGSYEEAFRQHEEKFDGSLVQDWKKALREVGAISGWEVKKTADGHQGKLVRLIVRRILRELKKGYLNVTGNLVGIDDHVQNLLRLLGADSDIRTCIAGIHGIGGIGKTTLAKVVYNRLSEKFQYCSFLESIRDKDLRSLQGQIISDILREEDVTFSSLAEGVSNIKKRFCNKRVLIVLDDVDHHYQLENLAGSHDWFGRGSKIIVTTRIRSILHPLEFSLIYELEQLDTEQSLQLFSMHAFRTKKPPRIYSALSNQFVSIADGLPLALELLGSSLCGKDKSKWESRLKNLRNRPLREVADKLKISYEALSYEEQEMFLDIACLFLGMDIDIAIHMWYTPNYDPREGIENLLDMSLVKIGDDFRLKMHDQLRDLGKDIVRKEDIEEPGMRSRVWNDVEAYDILSNKKGTDRVKALRLDVRMGPFSINGGLEYLYSYYDTQFKQLPKLKFLQVDFSKLIGNFHQLLPELRWLQWRGCPPTDIPSNFTLENLVILDLSWSKVTESWNGWNEIKVGKLKVLNLSGCRRLKKTPNLSAYRNLERLVLERCECLVEIDKSVAELKNLASLNLRYCSRLKMIPPELEDLNGLQELFIDETSVHNIHLPGSINKFEILHANGCRDLQVDSISYLTSLKELTLDESGITNLPQSISLLVNLQNLSLKSCWSLGKLPNWISELESLVELQLDFSGVEEVPEAIKELPCLQILGLWECPCLQSVPALPSTITDLRFSWHGASLKFPNSINLQLCFAEKSVSLSVAVNLLFPKLEILQFSNEYVTALLIEFATFTCLKELTVTNCDRLQCISEFPRSLSSLQLDSCGLLEKLPDLSDMKNLMQLSITRCDRITEIHGLGLLKSLQHLHVTNCEGLRYFSELPPSLSSLQIDSCALLEKLPDLSNLKNLLELSIVGCNRLTEIHGLGGLELLMNLHLVYCERLQCISELPSSLSSLRIDSCELLEKVPDLSNLKNLLKLSIVRCNRMTEIYGLGGLERLQQLDVSRCGHLCMMDGIQQLQCLELLDIIDCNSLRLPDLSCLEKLIVRTEADMINLVVYRYHELVKFESNVSKYSKAIETLDLLNPYMISLPEEFHAFTRLRKLTLVELVQFQSLPKLPSSLTDLCVRECNSIVEWPDFSNLKKLSELVLFGPCDSLIEIQGLAELESLTRLTLVSCRNLKTLSGLEQLKFLRRLYLVRCTSLQRLPNLSNLNVLESLEASYCDMLGKIEGLEGLNLKNCAVHGCPRAK